MGTNIENFSSCYIPSDTEMVIHDDHYNRLVDPGSMARQNNLKKGMEVHWQTQRFSNRSGCFCGFGTTQRAKICKIVFLTDHRHVRESKKKINNSFVVIYDILHSM